MQTSPTGPGRTDTTGTAVVEAIAEAEGVPPREIDTPLYEVLDPDALGALVDPSGSAQRRDLRVEFSYCGYRVAVRRDETVAIERRDGTGTADRTGTED